MGSTRVSSKVQGRGLEEGEYRGNTQVSVGTWNISLTTSQWALVHTRELTLNDLLNEEE